MRHLVFLCWLLAGSWVASGNARAQVRAPALLSDSAALAARDDTTMAVQRLFRLRRHEGVRNLVLSTLLVGSTTYSLASNHPETAYQRVSSVGLLALAGLSVWQAGAAIGQRWRYRPRHEEALLDQYDQGQPLPRWVRRRLTPTYFGAQRRTN